MAGAPVSAAVSVTCCQHLGKCVWIAAPVNSRITCQATTGTFSRRSGQSVPFFILQMFAPLLYVQGACCAIYPALESSGQSLRCVQGCDPTLDNGETRTAAREAQELLLASTGLVA